MPCLCLVISYHEWYEFCDRANFMRWNENRALLRYYAASSGYSLPTFRGIITVPYSGFLTVEDGTDSLSRNVCEELPLHAA